MSKLSSAALVLALAAGRAAAEPGPSIDASAKRERTSGRANPSTGEPKDAASDSDGEVIVVQGAAPKEPAREVLSTEELHELPGGGNDALRSLQTLPGVARIPFGLGGLALRGASPHDTRVFLDGVEVPILYHFGGLASFVPIDVLDKVELTPSGFGARWGRGIGGVVVLDTATQHPTHWTAGGEISLLHTGALAVGPGPDHGSWTIGVRRSYVDAVLALAQVNLALAPSYLDAQIKWQSGDHKWEALAFGSDDDLAFVHDPNDNSGAGGISTQSVKSLDYHSRFVRLAGRYASGGATITPWLGVDDLTAMANHKGVDKGYTRTDLVAGLRAEDETPVPGGVVRVGFDGKATHYDYTITNTPPLFPGSPGGSGVIRRVGHQDALDQGLFLEGEWLLDNGVIAIRPGARVDYFGLAADTYFDPRLAIVERTHGGVAITETIGLYHEAPLVTDLDPIFGPRPLAAPRALQASASFEAPVGELFDGKITAYGQHQDALPVDVVSGATPISDNGGEQAGGLLAISRELVDEEFGSYSYREYVGAGNAYGLELVAKKDLGALTGWIAYTYSRAFRTGDPRKDPRYYPYVLDQPHQLVAVATRPLGKNWRIGGRLRLASGNPITPVAAAYYSPDKMNWVAVDGPLLSQRLPAFFQLDLRIDRLWRRRCGIWALFVDVQNVTNNDNVEGVTYSMDYTRQYFTHGLPVFPSIGVEYRPTVR